MIFHSLLFLIESKSLVKKLFKVILAGRLPVIDFQSFSY